MIYEWKCKGCNEVYDLPYYSSDEPVICRHCNDELKRYYGSIQLPRTSAFQPHFNYSVGQHVSSEREFTDALKRTSEVQSLRTGIDHSYVPVLPGDMPQPTKNDEIFETRNKIVRDTGLTHGEIT